MKKNYGKLEAVKGISFQVRQGELFSFLGSNGAKKSTTIEILCTLLKKDSGNIQISGFDLEKQENISGMLLEPFKKNRE